MEREQLIGQFPAFWQGMVGSTWNHLRADGAESWLAANRSTEGVDWAGLVRALCQEELQDRPGKFTFAPRLLVLPVHLQRTLTTFLYQHKEEIPTSDLETFLSVLKQEGCNTYLSVFATLFEQHIVKSRLHQSGSEATYSRINTLYQFSPVNKARAEELCRSLSQMEKKFPSSPFWHRPREKGPCDTGDVQKPPATPDPAVISQSHKVPPGSSPPSLDTDSPVMEVDRVQEDSLQSPSKKIKLDTSPVSRDEGTQSSPRLPATEAAIELDPEIKVKATLLKEVWHESGDPKIPVPMEIEILSQSSIQQVEMICDLLELKTLSEVGIATACEHIISLATDLSRSTVECFSRKCLLPQVQGLEQNCSRTLFASMTAFCTAFPSPGISGVLVPALASQGSQAAQADLACRLLKAVYKVHQREEFIRELLKASPVWDEPLISVLQSLVDSKTDVSAATLDDLLSSFANHTSALADNLKFGKLMLALLNKYGSLMSASHLSSANHIVTENKTFLKKPLLSALKKIT